MIAGQSIVDASREDIENGERIDLLPIVRFVDIEIRTEVSADVFVQEQLVEDVEPASWSTYLSALPLIPAIGNPRDWKPTRSTPTHAFRQSGRPFPR